MPEKFIEKEQLLNTPISTFYETTLRVTVI